MEPNADTTIDMAGTEWVPSGSGWGWERVHPPPSSPPLKSAEGWAAWAPHLPPGTPQGASDSPWETDGGPDADGWVQSDSQLAAHMMNAAYTAAYYGGPPVSRLNCHWHRPYDHDVQPLGYNARGDIAPAPVHICLARALEAAHHTGLEKKLAHGMCDKIWLLHSRSKRLAAAVHSAFNFLVEAQRLQLIQSMASHPLTDFRLVMATVDPREKLVYGNTRDSAPAPRLMHTVVLHSESRQQLDLDEGELEVSDGERPGRMEYMASLEDQQLSDMRRHIRRMRRLKMDGESLHNRANQAEIAVDEMTGRMERAGTLRRTLMRGIQAQRGPLPLLERQVDYAWYSETRARVEADQAANAERPPTPDVDM